MSPKRPSIDSIFSKESSFIISSVK